MEPVAAALAQLAEAQAVCNFLTGLCAKELEALSDSASHATSPAWASAGIAAVVRLCHDPASAASAAATLANLSWDDDANGDRIREAGAIPQLVALLSGGPESDAGTKAALVLGYLASNVSLGLAHIVTITEAGAIPLLVALLTGGPESDAATNAALALGYLASSGANTVAITEAGAIPLLVALLSGGPESNAATNAAFALGHLAESGANTVAITEAGALALLVALLSGGPDSEAAEHAAGVLRNLTLNDNATSTAITNAGAIPPLVALLSGGSEPRAADAAAGALHNLACYTNSKAVLLEMARTQTDCSSWQSLCVTLHEFASARLQAAEAERQKRLLRLWEINGDAERQARRESFGLGSLELPDEFVCPITMDKMRDPVVASDGHSYERSAILSVFRDGNCLSPLTREPLQPTLFSNWNLKRRMQEHEEDILRAAATAVANASDGAQQQGPAAGGGEPSTEPAPKRRRRTLL